MKSKEKIQNKLKKIINRMDEIRESMKEQYPKYGRAEYDRLLLESETLKWVLKK